jgi:BASS family bile acid:Na+ symporter
MQNCGLVSGIAASLGKVSTVGLAAIIFGPIMNTTASILANWWRLHPTQSKVDCGERASSS